MLVVVTDVCTRIDRVAGSRTFKRRANNTSTPFPEPRPQCFLSRSAASHSGRLCVARCHDGCISKGVPATVQAQAQAHHLRVYM